jgi:predicted lipoprotein with Yx(FWY)xxD motif
VRKSYLAIGALALLAVLVIAGCGGGGSNSSSATTSEPEPASTTAESEATTETAAAPEGSDSAAETKQAAAAEKPAESGAGASGATTAAVVKVTNTDDLGKVIVESKGMTLYDFHKDKGTTSSCYGACAEAWPPLLTTGKPKAMGGAEPSLLGTTKRKDGTVQVTYNGHPLYGFVEDKKPGETNGNDVTAFGAEWYALEPNGEEPDDDDDSGNGS